jgi:hypothetical protein
VSNVDRTGRSSGSSSLSPSTGTPSAPRARVLAPNSGPVNAGNDIPSAAGTAVLDLSADQVTQIRVLLTSMRLGKSLADDVRKRIFDLLTKGQRRVVGSAWFIISVRA